MSEALIRPFQTTEWREYRNLRLAALKDSPDAFGSTYEQTVQLPDAEWQERLKRISLDRDYPLSAQVDGEFVGMAWIRKEDADSEVAHLYQLWVSSHFRNQGIGRKLLDAALQWAQNYNLKAIILEVTCGDNSARKLYESLGFKPIGDPKPLRPKSAMRAQAMILEFKDVSST